MGTTDRSLLLGVLRDEGPRSRVALGERLGVPRARLAGEVSRLIDDGLVGVGGPAASRGGRRSTLLHLAGDLRFLAVDVGATAVGVAVTDGRCEVLAWERVECDVRDGPAEVLGRIVDLSARVRDKAPGRLLAGGVGLPGSPVPGWDGQAVREELAAHWGLPVAVDDQVNLMALGERHAGVARAQADLVFVKLGTGIGCGIVLGGRVHRGVSGVAGDIGHIRLDDFGPACVCGEVGCLEAYFGGAAIARDALTLARSGRSAALAEALAERGRLTAADVGAAAAAGDFAAANLVREGGHRLGQVIASLVSFLNPGMVVIGGGVSQLGHPLLAHVRGVVYRRSRPRATGNLPIVLSELGEQAGVIGAAWLATDHTFS